MQGGKAGRITLRSMVELVFSSAKKRLARIPARRLTPALGALIGVAALSAASHSASANVITGGISFNGNVTPYNDSTGGSGIASGYSVAHSLVFGPTTVSLGANGSFAGITSGTPVSMYSPLQINPPALPLSNAALWSVTVGITTYQFTIATMTENVDTPNALELQGSGTLSDGTPADNSVGDWFATFTTFDSTFSWNCSSGSTAVPEPSSLALIGISSAGLMARRRRARRAA